MYCSAPAEPPVHCLGALSAISTALVPVFPHMQKEPVAAHMQGKHTDKNSGCNKATAMDTKQTSFCPAASCQSCYPSIATEYQQMHHVQGYKSCLCSPQVLQIPYPQHMYDVLSAFSTDICITYRTCTSCLCSPQLLQFTYTQHIRH